MNVIAEPIRAETKTALNQLDQLKQMTTVVADTGDFSTLRQYAPQDATTNPSLIYKVAEKPEYVHLLDKAVADSRNSGLSGAALAQRVMDHLLIAFGVEILKIVPGRVSTETDANLSFDTKGLVNKAHDFIKLYKQNGVG